MIWVPRAPRRGHRRSSSRFSITGITPDLATVITTNVPLEQHERRICSRMLDQRLSTVFAITAPPYRLSGPSAACANPTTEIR